MKEFVAHEMVQESSSAWLIEIQCSPYYQNTAFYPVAQLFEHTVLGITASDPVETNYAKLEDYLAQSGLELDENVPLFVPLLSPAPNPALSPTRHALDPQQTANDGAARRAALTARRRATRVVHRGGPALGRSIDARSLGPCHPKSLSVASPHNLRSASSSCHRGAAPMTQLSSRFHVSARRRRERSSRISYARSISLTNSPHRSSTKPTASRSILIAGNVYSKADPIGSERHYELSGTLEDFALPATLQDSLMARLDRLSLSKAIAQLAASLGREFPHQLLKAVAPVSEALLGHELAQLVGAELLFQHGTPPEARYTFKHALIQDAAYQPLLKSTRQGYHRRLLRCSRDIFEDAANQPELLAHHYTEAKNLPAAVAEWLKAGRRGRYPIGE